MAGGKGITVYRESSCEQQTLTVAGSSRRSMGGMDKGPAPGECPCELGADEEDLVQCMKGKEVTLP